MLTYSCPVDVLDNPIPSKELLLDFLKTIRNIKAAIVSKELHESGKVHYHAYCWFHPKLNSRDSKLFDFCNVHPNIGTTENQRAMINYVCKHGDVVCHNIDPAEYLKKEKVKRDKFYKDALQTAMEGDISAARKLLRENDTIRYCTSHSSIEAALRSAYSEGQQNLNPVLIEQGGWCTDAQNIDLKHKNDGERYFRTHVLVGDAGIGKTQLAKYLLHKAGCRRIAVVRSCEQLRPIIDDIDGFVFDELNVNAPDVKGGRWTRESQIALVDREEEGAIPCRYNDVVLKRHIVRIITTNMLSRAIDIQDAAIARRVQVHDLGATRLFN